MTLTRPQIEAMPAGWEMDREVAAAIGWTDIAGSKYLGYTGLRPGFPAGFNGHVAIPDFSTDFAAANTLLDAWEQSGRTWAAGYDNNNLSNGFLYWRDLYVPDQLAHKAYAETLPLCICRARLLAALESEGA